jgi:putative aminopeptidase FrvX
VTPTLKLFEQLTSVPTAPFQESSVAAVALKWMAKELPKSVKIKKLRGGIVATYAHAPGPALVLGAHLDHPAFAILSASAKGAKARLLGGLRPDLLPGAAVEAFAAKPKDNVPLARGVLEKTADAELYEIRWTEPPKKGGKPAFACLALTPMTIDAPWVQSRSIDDLMGCAISLDVLRRVAGAGLKTNLTVVLHRAEEVGFIGALDLIAEGAIPLEDSFLSIETSKQLPGAQPGEGPVLRVGDKACLFDANLLAVMEQTADHFRHKGLPSQRLRLTGGTCEATAYLAFGYESAGLAIPLVNYHNSGDKGVAPEMVRLDDVDNAVRLLVEIARAWPQASPRGKMKEKLSARLKAMRPQLTPL